MFSLSIWIAGRLDRLTEVRQFNARAVAARIKIESQLAKEQLRISEELAAAKFHDHTPKLTHHIVGHSSAGYIYGLKHEVPKIIPEISGNFKPWKKKLHFDISAYKEWMDENAKIPFE